MHAATYTTLPGLLVTRSGGHEMELFADHSQPLPLNSFNRIFHSERYGEMYFQYFVGEGFQIWRSHYLMHEQMNVRSQGDISMLELHIPLAGDAMSWWDGKKENRLRKFQFELEYIPFINSDTLFAQNNTCVTLDIHYDKSFIQSYAQQFPVVNDFLSRVEAGERAHLLGHAVRLLSPQMMRVVYDILHYSGTREFASFYYHQQVSIILEMVLERAMHVNDNYSSKKYLDAAVSVRELIERDPSTAFTGKLLSEHTGVNVSLLHKIFKEFNGTTIFDFSQGLRLEHAKSLLRDTSLYIFEIALECGYPEHANFTIAFRKRFGFTPQQFRETLAGQK